MTYDEIRAAIAADPALQALLPDTVALAEALSAGRVTATSRLGGVGVVLETLGPAAGAALLDLFEGLAAQVPAVKWAWVLINRGELDFGSPATRAQLVALRDQGLISAEVCTALLGIAEVPDPVAEFDVRCAIFNDDGTLRV